MENENKTLEYIDVKDIPDQGELKKSINTRSWPALLVTLCTGIFIMLLNFKYRFIVGGVMVALGLAGHFLMKQATVVNLYADSMICYYVMDTSKAVCIRYEDIEVWDVNNEKSELVIKLKDGSFLNHFCPRSTLTFNALNKIIPEKHQQNFFQKRLSRFKKDK